MIIYLHGFNSTDTAQKAQRLKQLLAPEIVLSPTYPPNPEEAIKYLEEFTRQAQISRNTPGGTLMFIGTSLGGFYAQYLGRLFKAKVVMINPALDPMTVLKPYIGENINFNTGEKYNFTQQYLYAFKPLYIDDPAKDIIPTLVLLDEGDKSIDYRTAAERYKNYAIVVTYKGGNHRFAHLNEAVEIIKNFYYNIY